MICLVAITIFLTDFLIKAYFKNHFAYQSIPIIKNILHITVVFNKGAAFGILRDYSSFLIYFTLIFIIILILNIRANHRRDKLDNILLGLILGGALSNFCDRIIYGFVVDYIDIRIWPVFNLSDMSISIGTLVFILRTFKKDNYYGRSSLRS
ncbi:MAG: signal peptidase II [Candidatus Omnitrophica bacterium]|nr:signal peptidase II [Candidatus Omnitrophota bacterium]